MKKLIIVGNGGHSKVVQEIVRKSDYQLIEIWDDKYSEVTCIDGINYAPIDVNHPFVEDKSVFFFLAIGDNSVRKKIANRFNINKSRYATILAPSAIISTEAFISGGSLVMEGAIIQAGSTIGDQVIVNSGSIIDHDCQIEEYVHVAPGATITGHCTVRQMSLIGAGSTLIPSVVVEEHATIGAGSVVIKNVPANKIAYGNPAKYVTN